MNHVLYVYMFQLMYACSNHLYIMLGPWCADDAMDDAFCMAVSHAVSPALRDPERPLNLL